MDEMPKLKKRYTAEFKKRAFLNALKEDKTLVYSYGFPNMYFPEYGCCTWC